MLGLIRNSGKHFTECLSILHDRAIAGFLLTNNREHDIVYIPGFNEFSCFRNGLR